MRRTRATGGGQRLTALATAAAGFAIASFAARSAWADDAKASAPALAAEAAKPTAPAGPLPAAPPAAAGAALSSTPGPAPTRSAAAVSATTPQRGLIAEPAPRPTAAVRVQSRYAQKANLLQVYGAVEYLSRGDFYDSPGARVGAAYYPLEALGIELQISHYWSSLDAEAERVKQSLGAIPDSHAPGWLALAGARYSIGYGKVMVGGLGGVIHFEPQAFAHVGLHDHDGDIGPSGDLGLGFMVFLTPKLFARIDAAVVLEREQRSGQGVAVWGTLPSIGVGGIL